MQVQLFAYKEVNQTIIVHKLIGFEDLSFGGRLNYDNIVTLFGAVHQLLCGKCQCVLMC